MASVSLLPSKSHTNFSLVNANPGPYRAGNSGKVLAWMDTVEATSWACGPLASPPPLPSSDLPLQPCQILVFPQLYQTFPHFIHAIPSPWNVLSYHSLVSKSSSAFQIWSNVTSSLKEREVFPEVPKQRWESDGAINTVEDCIICHAILLHKP